MYRKFHQVAWKISCSKRERNSAILYRLEYVALDQRPVYGRAAEYITRCAYKSRFAVLARDTKDVRQADDGGQHRGICFRAMDDYINEIEIARISVMQRRECSTLNVMC